MKKPAHHHKVHRLQLGTLGIDKSFMTYWHDCGVDLSETFPIQFFYIEGPEEKILVDTGGPAEENNKYWFGAKDIRTFEEALDSVSLKPEDVDIIILTHAHFDHALNIRKCPNARVYIQKEELKFSYSPHRLMRGIYDPAFFTGVKLIPIEGDVEIVPGVKAMSSPGHTPGTQSVAVDTKDGVALITGFCCIEENFRECPEPFKDNWNNTIPVGIATCATDALDSMLRARGVADIIIPSHGREIPDVIG